MDKNSYLTAISREARAFAAVLRSNLDRPAPVVPSCPGWKLIDLTLHLGAVHRRIEKQVQSRLTEPIIFSRDNLAYLELPSPYLEWLLEGRSPDGEKVSTFLLDWFEQGVAKLGETLAKAEPDEPAWFWGKEHRVGSWQRAMAIETAIHRWDAQNAMGNPEQLEPDLAADAIDFVLDERIHYGRSRRKAPNGQGEVYHFHRTDGPGEWVVKFDPEGVTVRREHAKGDVAARGSASDLALFLYNRVGPEKLEVFGNAALLERFFELAPSL